MGSMEVNKMSNLEIGREMFLTYSIIWQEYKLINFSEIDKMYLEKI